MKYKIKINQHFCIKNKIDKNQGSILSVLNDCESVSFSYIKSHLPFIFKEKSTLSKSLRGLVNKEIVKKTLLSDIEAYSLLNKDNSDIGCLFCSETMVNIHGHHYPIRAKDNGLKTIDLCPNCHSKFHIYTDYGVYDFNEIYKQEWNLLENNV